MKQIFALVLVVFNGIVFGQDHQVWDRTVDELITNAPSQPGVAVAVVYAGETYTKVTGMANLEYRIPLTTQSVFDLASVSKQFTGFAIAYLLEEGTIKLQDPLQQYFPEFEYLPDNMQISHLVYHTSGLRDIGELYGLTGRKDPLTAEVALDILARQKNLNFPVGSAYDYSNSNYVLLAVLVERVTGESFKSWCRDHIFAPLDMTSTFVNDNPRQVIPNRAIAYYGGNGDFHFQQENGMSLIGSSAVYSTLDDMIRWIQYLHKEEVFPKVFQRMKKSGHLDNGQPIGYGFGLSIGTFKGQLRYEHSGATPAGFRTQMGIFPDKGFGFVVLSNWGELEPIPDLAIPIIRSFYPIKQQEILSKDTEQFNSSTVEFHPTELERFTGQFLFNGELPVRIRKGEDASLRVQLEGQNESMLVGVDDTTFLFPELQSTLYFQTLKDGTFSSVAVFVGQEKQGTLERVADSDGVEESTPLSSLTGTYVSEELGTFFLLSNRDEQLVMDNGVYGAVFLEHKGNRVFIPAKPIASSITFSRSAEGITDGFYLQRGSRLREVWFAKIRAY